MLIGSFSATCNVSVLIDAGAGRDTGLRDNGCLQQLANSRNPYGKDGVILSMDWIGRREQLLMLGVMILTGAWGYSIDRIVGGGLLGAIVYSLLGVVFVGVLLFGLTQGLPKTEVNRPVVAAGALLLFGLVASVQYELIPRLTERINLLLLGASSVGLGVVIGFVSADDATTGLVHGILTGGVTALLLVFIAVQQSFSMRPALTGIVLIVLILGPPILGVIVGIGGAIGGSCHSISLPKGAAE